MAGRRTDDPTADADARGRAVGTFSFDLADQVWAWSDEMFRIHGYEPGEIAPSLAVLLEHADDVADAERHIDEVLATGQPFSCYHRIRTADGALRPMLTVAEGVVRNGAVVRVQGALMALDLVRDAITAAAAGPVPEGRRAGIDQATGMLALIYGVRPQEAMALLVHGAESTGSSVLALSEELVAAAHEQRDLSALSTRIARVLAVVPPTSNQHVLPGVKNL